MQNRDSFIIKSGWGNKPIVAVDRSFPQTVSSCAAKTADGPLMSVIITKAKKPQQPSSEMEECSETLFMYLI